MKNIILFLTTLLPFSIDVCAVANENNGVVSDPAVIDSINRDMSLDNITVVTSRIRQKANGFSLNLTNSKLSDMLTMDQMLSLLPYVSSTDGSVSIYNQAASAIYIDGVKIVNREQLKMLRPELIERIEVDYFNNGSESAGNPGGIMRIWLKHREKGYLIGIGGETSAKTENGYDGYGFKSYQMGSTGRFTIYNAVMYDRGLSSEKYRTYTQSGSDISVSDEKYMNNSNTFGDWLSITADAGHNRQVGITAGVSYFRNKGTLGADINETAEGQTADYGTVTWRPQTNLTLNGTAFYNWKINDRGSNLNVTADYLWYKRNREDNYNVIASAGLRPGYSQNADNYTKLLRVKSTWQNVQQNGNTLTAGLDYKLTDFSETEHVMSMRQSVTDHEPAIFASYSGAAGKLSYNANVRVQYNNLKVTANGLTDKRDYWSLCPSAVLRYELSRKHRHNVSLSYQRTVYGLPYDGISTYRVYDGANHYSMGNPYLDVPSRHMVDLRLSLFNQFDVRLSYTKEEKSTFYAEEADPDNPGSTRSVLRNSDGADTKMILVQWAKYPTKWLYFKVSGYAAWDTFRQPEYGYSNKFRWYLYATCTMWLKHNWIINIDGAYDPEKYFNGETYMNTVWNVGMTVAKSFMKKRLQVGLTVTPPYTPRVTKVTKNDLAYRREKLSHGAYIGLKLSYTISGGKLRQRKKAQSIQQYEEQKHDY